MMKRIISIITCLLYVSAIMAQQMTVQAPQSVYAGDNFTVRFVVDARANDFHGPSFKGFSLRSGPNTSSSSSYSFVNGQMTSSVQTVYSYTLTADVVGTFTVDAASCSVDGKRISSKSIEIRVEKSDPSRRAQQQQSRQQTYDPWVQQAQSAQEIDEKSLFARASVNKNNPYQGEQVIVTYKIYTQVPISQFAIDKLPGNRGFWSEDLSEGSQIKQYEETVDGRRYQVAEIRRGALFAQEIGRLTIEPLDLNVLAMVQRQRRRTGSIFDLFDDPFFSAREAVERPLSTNRIPLNVRPLPTSPDEFSGAVGRFEVQGGLSLGKVKANEAVSYRLTVNGSGNLMLINPPTPDFPSVFEVYDPRIEDNIKRGPNGISGSRTYEWVLIPRSQGNYIIPEFRFVFFDPANGQYVTRTIDKQTIEVEKGDARHQTQMGSKDDVKLLNNDINYIHPIGKLRYTKFASHAGWHFWLLAVLIIAATIGILLYGRRRQRAEQDVAGMRRKHALKVASKRLKYAEKHLKDSIADQFYEEIYRAIWGCIADKYNIPLSNLNRDSVIQCLVEKQVPVDQQERIMKVLQEVDLARFTPGDSHVQMQSVYDDALNMIVAL